MPYIIPHVRNLEDCPPRMLIGHRLLPETHPLRRFEEHKRLVYARDYAYMCLVGFVPAKEEGGRRPERKLRRAPLPPGSPGRKVLQKSLPPDLPAPPPGPGPSTPRSPMRCFRRNPADTPFDQFKKTVGQVSKDSPGATWKRVFGQTPPRPQALRSVLEPIDINHIRMIPNPSNEDNLVLVPLGSENAVPTVRGIIEEYYEEQEYEQTPQTSTKQKRTPVYLSPEQAQLTAEAIRRKSNMNRTAGSSSARLPPKAQQLLGSPRPPNVHNNVEQSPLHSKGNSTNSLRLSASSRVASLFTPTKARKSSTSTLANNKVVKRTSSSSQHTTFSHKRTATSSSISPLKYSSTISSVSIRKKMSAQQSPTKQATAGAPPNESNSESSKSPVKSFASSKKEDFSLKRALSNALTPKKREDVPPPPPRKDTPPPADDKPARLSANIVDVRGASDAYSGNGFAATTEDAEDETPTNNSPETITVAFSDSCSPIKEVKSGVVKMTHASHSPFVGQKAVFEADPKVVKEIQEEFESPAMAPALFRSPHVGKMSPKSAQKIKTPRYIAGGLLEGGLLPATTYQPPPKISEKIDPKNEIYSPSMYSVATGHDVFNTNTYGVAAQESSATPTVPSNSPVNAGEQPNNALPRASVQPVQYISTVRDNDYVYRPDDHIFNRHRGETPVLTQDFSTTGAEQKQASPDKGPINVDTPANKTNGYGGLQNDVYEYPSAKPRPLRRVSGYSSSRSSSGRSLRDLYHEAGGLGIELSENSRIYAHDNGTTLGVDGDSNFERRRDMVNMRSPDFYVKQSGFASTASQRRQSKEHKHQSYPVESTKYMVDAVHSRHKEEMQNTLDLLDGKIERLVAAQSLYKGVLTNTRDSIDQIIAEQRKIREIMDAMLFENRKTREIMNMLVANHHVVRDTLQTVVVDTRLLHDVSADIRIIHNVAADTLLLHQIAADTRSVQAESRKMHQSITDLAEHGVDNEKLDFLVDKVVERLHPTIIWAMEKGDHNTERVLTRLGQGKEDKQRKSHDRVASQTSNNGYSSTTDGVHFAPSSNLNFSPSAVGPFASNHNEYFSSPTHHLRNRTGDYDYSEDPSQR